MGRCFPHEVNNGISLDRLISNARIQRQDTMIDEHDVSN